MITSILLLKLAVNKPIFTVYKMYIKKNKYKQLVVCFLHC